MSMNTKELMRLLTLGGPAAVKTLGQALYKEGAVIFEESQDEVPVDTTALKTSGNLHFPQIVNGELVVDIVYGGASADYAIYVHEDLEARHKPGKKAKFLEDPARRRIKGMDGRLLAMVKKAMGV